MAVGADWPRSRNGADDYLGAGPCNCRGAWSRGVEVAKVHVQPLDSPCPVMCTPEIYYSLRAVAHHPTGIDLRVTEGLGHGWKARRAGPDRSVYTHLPIGKSTSEIGHYLPIPPDITETDTRRAEPVYFGMVIHRR